MLVSFKEKKKKKTKAGLYFSLDLLGQFYGFWQQVHQ